MNVKFPSVLRSKNENETETAILFVEMYWRQAVKQTSRPADHQTIRQSDIFLKSSLAVAVCKSSVSFKLAAFITSNTTIQFN
jgi:hypothetical protein